MAVDFSPHSPGKKALLKKPLPQGLQTLLFLWPYFWPHHEKEMRLRFALTLIVLIVAKLVTVFIPVVFKLSLDALTHPFSTPDLIPTGNPWILLPLGLIIAYGAVRILASLFTEAHTLLFTKVEQRALRLLSLTVFKHIHSLSLRFHLDRKTGGLSRVIERGKLGIEQTLRFLLSIILPTLLEVIFVSLFLFWIYPPVFSLVILLTMLLYTWFTIQMTHWRIKFIHDKNKADEDTQTKEIDSLLNYETIKYFNNESLEADRFDTSLRFYEKASIRFKLSLAALNLGQSFIISLGMVIMMIMTAYAILKGELTLGDFVLMNIYLLQLYIPLNNLGFAYRETKQSLINIDRMLSLLNTAPEIKDNVGARPLKLSQGLITFDQVSFEYTKERPILTDISFIIHPGETVAIVGPSGAGKSTIVRLLMRFYEPTHGSISIDHQNIQKVTQHSLRKAIGVVPQDTVLFNDTLGYNVHYGKATASLKSVKEAITMAHLENLTQKLPQGLNTLVGERGLKLSGGEKQRVALARVLLKKTPILVFDEATSSLDSHAENAIQKNIQAISKKHTTLIIAHRLSTIVHAHQILVLDHGRITERGTHQDLLKQKGLYAQLWNKQRTEKESPPSENSSLL